MDKTPDKFEPSNGISWGPVLSVFWMAYDFDSVSHPGSEALGIMEGTDTRDRRSVMAKTDKSKVKYGNSFCKSSLISGFLEKQSSDK